VREVLSGKFSVLGKEGTGRVTKGAGESDQRPVIWKRRERQDRGRERRDHGDKKEKEKRQRRDAENAQIHREEKAREEGAEKQIPPLRGPTRQTAARKRKSGRSGRDDNLALREEGEKRKA
jgi:hypothetical protein